MVESNESVETPDIFWGEDKKVVSRRPKRTEVDFSEYRGRVYTKTCQLCGEKFRAKSNKAKYCPGTCRRVARRNNERRYRKRVNGKPLQLVGDIKTCPVCSESFMVRSHNQKYCNECQGRPAEAWQRGYERQLGIEIECVICGETIKRTGSNTIYCKQKCSPPEGKTIKCVTCGDEKAYADFYDYRGRDYGKSKFVSSCKDCIRARSLEYHHKKH